MCVCVSVCVGLCACVRQRRFHFIPYLKSDSCQLWRTILPQMALSIVQMVMLVPKWHIHDATMQNVIDSNYFERMHMQSAWSCWFRIHLKWECADGWSAGQRKSIGRWCRLMAVQVSFIIYMFSLWQPVWHSEMLDASIQWRRTVTQEKTPV